VALNVWDRPDDPLVILDLLLQNLDQDGNVLPTHDEGRDDKRLGVALPVAEGDRNLKRTPLAGNEVDVATRRRLCRRLIRRLRLGGFDGMTSYTTRILAALPDAFAA
jgi:hypothetical protein